MTRGKDLGIIPGSGTPGSYATALHGEGDALALDSGTDWGRITESIGSRTPWGSADNIEYITDGIAFVSTASHGGYRLSPERNAEVDPALRRRGGWYEEDSDANIVDFTFAEDLEGSNPRDARSADQIRADAEKNLRDWMPDEYTSATGVTLTAEDSYMLRERAKVQTNEQIRAENADKFVTLGNGNNHDEWIPAGYSVCKARRDADGEVREYLMPMSDVVKDHSYGEHVVIDAKRHLDVTDIAADAGHVSPWAEKTGPVVTGEALKVSTVHLTRSQAQRANAELTTRYRFDTERGQVVEDLETHLRRVGVTGKKMSSSDTAANYWVKLGDGSMMQVKKPTYDAMVNVPDTTSELGRASVEVTRAHASLERARREGTPGKVAKAEERLAEVRQTYRAMSDRSYTEARAFSQASNARKKAALAELLASRGIELDQA